MTQAIPLYIVLLIAVALALVWFIHYWVSRSIESARRTEAAVNQLSQAAANIRDHLEAISKELTNYMPQIPKLLDAVAQVGNAQLTALEEQRKRAANPFGRRTGPVVDRDVAAAEREHEITEMMRAEGVSREEAELRINPANEQTVWGGGIFDGWR